MVKNIFTSILWFSLSCVHGQDLGFSEAELIHRFIPEIAHKYIKSSTLKKLESPHFPSESRHRVEWDQLCGRTLLPLSKDQKEKTYHLELTISFDRMIPAHSPFCQVTTRGSNVRCIVAKRFKAKLLSDTYKDTCDRALRAFAWVTYTLPGEQMTDSVSPGRSLEVVQRFNGSTLYRPGEIKAVSLEKFEFFESFQDN